MHRPREIASILAFQPLYRLYRLSRPGLRPGAVARAEGLRYRRMSAAWPADEKRAAVLRRLREVVRRAARETRYYRDLFATVGFDPREDFSFEDYARLPVLERDDVRKAGSALLSDAISQQGVRRDATGGSTGTPTVIWTGPEERGWRESGPEYFMEQLGIVPGSSTAFLWAHHLDPMARDSFKDRLNDWLSNTEWLDCLRISPEILADFHRRLRRNPPACIIAYASALAALADFVVGAGQAARYPRRCLITGAEKLFPSQRIAIERAFGRPIHERYGSRDVGLIGFQLEGREGADLVIDWANIMVEPESADSVAPILITKLRADAMPMLRYRIGDLGTFPMGSGPGEPVFRLANVVGRDVDRLWLPDGRWVHGIGFPHLLKDFPVSDFQVLQHADFSVEVRIVASPGFDGGCEQAVLETIQANLPGLPVKIVHQPQIPRSAAAKWRPVISEVGRSGGPSGNGR